MNPLFLYDKTDRACLTFYLPANREEKKAGTERCIFSSGLFVLSAIVGYFYGLMEYIRYFHGIQHGAGRQFKKTVRNSALLDILILDAPV